MNTDAPEPDIDPTKEKLYNVRELSEMFQVTSWTVRMWVKKKKMGCFKINNRLYFTEKHIRDYANNRWGD